VSGWYSAELLKRDADAEMKALRPHLDLLKAMGSNVLVFAETSNAIHGDRSKPLSQRPRMQGRRLGRVRPPHDAGGGADPAGRRAGGLPPPHGHHRGIEADIDAFMRSTGEAVHLLLDTGHATWGGANPAELARRYRSRISHVHTKDVRREVMEKSKAEGWSFLDSVIAGVYTVPGDGMVDFAAVFRELPGYSGWVVIEAEQDPAKAHPLTYARMGFEHLTRVLNAAVQR
jgi:sugar phosphate isomerase/epimerase